MNQTALEILEKLMPYWEKREIREGRYTYFKYEDLGRFTGAGFSSRMTSDIAMGYLVYGLENNRNIYIDKALGMINYIIDHQHESGAFQWNLHDSTGAPINDQVDLGTVLDCYYHFLKLGVVDSGLKKNIRESAKKAIDYLRTAVMEGYPGVIKKRDRGPGQQVKVDVLNGNALAATAYVRAAYILDDLKLIGEAEPYINNLVNRFGAHFTKWWPYSEVLPDRTVTLDIPSGISIFFQAMTLLYMEPYYRARGGSLLETVMKEGLEAIDAMIDSDGKINYWHERRRDFINTQNIMLPACFYTLKDVTDLTAKAEARLWMVRDTMVREDGLLLNEDGKPADDMRRIWIVSDLALCILRG